MGEQLNMQALEHLALANAVRKKRAEDKAEIKLGRLAVSDILRAPAAYPHWNSAAIVDLLITIPRVGRHKAQRWLNLERVSPTRQVRNLTTRQRTMLAAHLDVSVYRRDDVRRALEGRAA